MTEHKNKPLALSAVLAASALMVAPSLDSSSLAQAARHNVLGNASIVRGTIMKSIDSNIFLEHHNEDKDMHDTLEENAKSAADDVKEKGKEELEKAKDSAKEKKEEVKEEMDEHSKHGAEGTCGKM
jgi:hypothetical protein